MKHVPVTWLASIFPHSSPWQAHTHMPAVLQDAVFQESRGWSSNLQTSEMPVTWRRRGDVITWLGQNERWLFFLCLFLRCYLCVLWSNPAVMKALQAQRVDFISSPGNNVLIKRSCYVGKVNTTCVSVRLWCLWLCRSELHCSIKASLLCCRVSNAFDKDCLALGLSVDILGACAVVWYS